MTSKIRGADIVARTLDGAGLHTVFTLSGNHIMPVFDAVLGTRLKLAHVRHEAAAVHMADAWARLTGECGIALVTGGPGHANAVGALYTAQAAEQPLVLLSGHAATREIGRGSFQELRQADMAEPAAKASWTASSADALGHDLARAVRIAKSGRPGPVHLSLPFDLLEEKVADVASLWPDAVGLRTRGAPACRRCSRRGAGCAGRRQAASDPGRTYALHGRGPRAVAPAGRRTGVPAIGMEARRRYARASVPSPRCSAAPTSSSCSASPTTSRCALPTRRSWIRLAASSSSIPRLR